MEKDRAETLKSKEGEKTLGNQAALGLLSISVMCKEKSMLEEIVEQHMAVGCGPCRYWHADGI